MSLFKRLRKVYRSRREARKARSEPDAGRGKSFLDPFSPKGAEQLRRYEAGYKGSPSPKTADSGHHGASFAVGENGATPHAGQPHTRGRPASSTQRHCTPGLGAAAPPLAGPSQVAQQPPLRRKASRRSLRTAVSITQHPSLELQREKNDAQAVAGAQFQQQQHRPSTSSAAAPTAEDAQSYCSVTSHEWMARPLGFTPPVPSKHLVRRSISISGSASASSSAGVRNSIAPDASRPPPISDQCAIIHALEERNAVLEQRNELFEVHINTLKRSLVKARQRITELERRDSTANAIAATAGPPSITTTPLSATSARARAMVKQFVSQQAQVQRQAQAALSPVPVQGPQRPLSTPAQLFAQQQAVWEERVKQVATQTQMQTQKQTQAQAQSRSQGRKQSLAQRWPLLHTMTSPSLTPSASKGFRLPQPMHRHPLQRTATAVSMPSITPTGRSSPASGSGISSGTGPTPQQQQQRSPPPPPPPPPLLPPPSSGSGIPQVPKVPQIPQPTSSRSGGAHRSSPAATAGATTSSGIPRMRAAAPRRRPSASSGNCNNARRSSATGSAHVAQQQQRPRSTGSGSTAHLPLLPANSNQNVRRAAAASSAAGMTCLVMRSPNSNLPVPVQQMMYGSPLQRRVVREEETGTDAAARSGGRSGSGGGGRRNDKRPEPSSGK